MKSLNVRVSTPTFSGVGVHNNIIKKIIIRLPLFIIISLLIITILIIIIAINHDYEASSCYIIHSPSFAHNHKGCFVNFIVVFVIVKLR